MSQLHFHFQYDALIQRNQIRILRRVCKAQPFQQKLLQNIQLLLNLKKRVQKAKKDSKFKTTTRFFSPKELIKSSHLAHLELCWLFGAHFDDSCWHIHAQHWMFEAKGGRGGASPLGRRTQRLLVLLSPLRHFALGQSNKGSPAFVIQIRKIIAIGISFT